ncbi:hypothetical protein K402DRAFT_456404 [Aulographum hederae CBS 113979]|uniref:Uncharacterized protein n=1 Tax=Aulographum hederae CBS 113979 TaxID=1176131 RepID=A0A6G1GRU7_9PEZI|nr:hypothetical protein K402DRAFT_456404 [Aulographum hederae CBS 113979]
MSNQDNFVEYQVPPPANLDSEEHLISLADKGAVVAVIPGPKPCTGFYCVEAYFDSNSKLICIVRSRDLQRKKLTKFRTKKGMEPVSLGTIEQSYRGHFVGLFKNMSKLEIERYLHENQRYTPRRNKKNKISKQRKCSTGISRKIVKQSKRDDTGARVPALEDTEADNGRNGHYSLRKVHQRSMIDVDKGYEGLEDSEVSEESEIDEFADNEVYRESGIDGSATQSHAAASGSSGAPGSVREGKRPAQSEEEVAHGSKKTKITQQEIITVTSHDGVSVVNPHYRGFYSSRPSTSRPNPFTSINDAPTQHEANRAYPGQSSDSLHQVTTSAREIRDRQTASQLAARYAPSAVASAGGFNPPSVAAGLTQTTSSSLPAATDDHTQTAMDTSTPDLTTNRPRRPSAVHAYLREEPTTMSVPNSHVHSAVQQAPTKSSAAKATVRKTFPAKVPSSNSSSSNHPTTTVDSSIMITPTPSATIETPTVVNVAPTPAMDAPAAMNPPPNSNPNPTASNTSSSGLGTTTPHANPNSANQGLANTHPASLTPSDQTITNIPPPTTSPTDSKSASTTICFRFDVNGMEDGYLPLSLCTSVSSFFRHLANRVGVENTMDGIPYVDVKLYDAEPVPLRARGIRVWWGEEETWGRLKSRLSELKRMTDDGVNIDVPLDVGRRVAS